MPRHSDFEKIYRQFIKRYGKEKGEQYYYAWLNKLGLDDTKPYGPQVKEDFQWAAGKLALLKFDENAKYYKVEALFPVESMNGVVYEEEELIRAARTLIGKPVNLNHQKPLEGVEIVDAEYENGAVECILRVENKDIQKMIDDGEILHVSIEADYRMLEESIRPKGLVFTGLALLTKETLPGVPLTRIIPVEKLVEKFVEQFEQYCDLCGRIVSDAVIVGSYRFHPSCAQAFWRIAFDVFHFRENYGLQFNRGENEEMSGKIEEREWDTAYINQLPDSAFAVIEPAYERGETEDKRCRHLPHHDSSGKIDLPHFRNALARLTQIQPVTDSISRDELIARAKKHLCAHAKALDIQSSVCETEEAKTPCESAKESLLKQMEALQVEVKQLKELLEVQKATVQKLTEENAELKQKLGKTKKLAKIIIHA